MIIKTHGYMEQALTFGTHTYTHLAPDLRVPEICSRIKKTKKKQNENKIIIFDLSQGFLKSHFEKQKNSENQKKSLPLFPFIHIYVMYSEKRLKTKADYDRPTIETKQKKNVEWVDDQLENKELVSF